MKVTGSEWYVLECLWEEEPQTLMNIFTRLNETQGWAKSTCATMLKRMEEKILSGTRKKDAQNISMQMQDVMKLRKKKQEIF